MSTVWTGLVGIFAELGTPRWIAFAALLMLAAPLVDRLVIRRKRIDYRVLYNSKIGLDPLSKHDKDDELSSDADPRLRHLTSMAGRMSVVIIRIRNVGNYDIEKKDFDEPISFTFGKRVVWDARISEASTPELRSACREHMAFFTEDHAPRRKPPNGDAGDLGAVRKWLKSRMFTTIEAGQTELGPQWHGVRLGRLALKRNEKFKLVVVLQEPDEHTGHELTKTVDVEGRIENGWIRDEKKKPRLTWAGAMMGVSVLLAGALVATSINSVAATEPAYCATGTIHVEGSSAFMPVVDRAVQKYEQECRAAEISTSASGSIDGLEMLGQETGSSSVDAVFSDAPAVDGNFHRTPIAVVNFAVVINEQADVPGLTSEQLRSIFSGQVTDWQEVGGTPGPIKIVDRRDLSGTRKVFESEIIKGTIESPEDPCDSKMLAPAAPVHCWSSDTRAVLNRVETTPGAIGFADANAALDPAQAPNLKVIPIDGKEPGEEATSSGRWRASTPGARGRRTPC